MPADSIFSQDPITTALQQLQFFWSHFLYPFFAPITPELSVLSIVLSLLFLAGIFHSILVLREVSTKEYHQFKSVDVEGEEAQKHRIEWQVVENHMAAENPAEWRLGILEADNLLEEVLREAGVPGEGLGERLKNMTEANLKSISDAWEAHKVRNRIAHDGSAFELTKREADRIIALYQKVLTELDYLH